MRRRQVLGLFLVATIVVPGMAVAGQFVHVDTDGLEAGVKAVQQHTVYLEIVAASQRDRSMDQVHQFAAVTVLVKRCLQRTVRNQFDNAVLWFNDQFLFGSKGREEFTINYTEGPTLGRQGDPNAAQTRTFGDANGDEEMYETFGEDSYDDEGNPTWDQDGSARFIRRNGSPSDGASDGEPARYTGCWIPDGFLMAIGGDDPYASGTLPATRSNTQIVRDNLMSLDNSDACQGCVFNYTGSFYFTDPNGFNWIVDKFVYASALVEPLVDPDSDGRQCLREAHFALDTGANSSVDMLYTACGSHGGRHADRAEDDGVGGDPADDRDNHCNDRDWNGDGTIDPSEECSGERGDPTDTPRRNTTKVVIQEPLYVVHLQVDEYKQGIRDEAPWAWRSGVVRNGVPRYEDAPHTEPGAGAGGYCPVDNQDVRCSIEYNAVLVVDLEAFDDVGSTLVGGGFGPTVEGRGENEIRRNDVIHGDGTANDGDPAKSGNSHRHGPTNDMDPGPAHTHDAVSLDLFVVSCDSRAGAGSEPCEGGRIPFWLTDPTRTYWRDGASGGVELGRPPRAASGDCFAVAPGDGHPMSNAPLMARQFIVCDTAGASAEYHAHDGSQTIS